MQMNNQQGNNQNQQNNTEEKAKKRRPRTEDDLLDLGYWRFKIDDDAEDNIIIKNKKKHE